MYTYIKGGAHIRVPKFDENNLEAICNVLGDTNDGLTGSQISKLLTQTEIEDVDPLDSKRTRLVNALSNKQDMDNCGNHVILFIQKAMNPVNYVKHEEIFENRRNDLNQVLSFEGYELSENSEIIKTSKVNTISEAQKRANHLNKKLTERNVHPYVLIFCKEELVSDNYFHAVFEATKSVADKIRDKSGLDMDGSRLVDKVFNVNKPILVINDLSTETKKSEQKGFSNLLKGMFGMFRNTVAHEPKIKWEINEEDALDLLTLISYIHRRLDNAQETAYKQSL